MELLAVDFDERDPAVKFLLKRAIDACRRQNKYVGICGQGPSDHPDFAQWLTDAAIESISLNPDTGIETGQALAKAAAKQAERRGDLWPAASAVSRGAAR